MPRSLSRKDNHRKSLLRNLITSLILYEEIKTTKAKAKEIRPIIENLINKAKRNDIVTQRKLLGYLYDKNATKKVFEVLIPRYKEIKSGFIKIYQLKQRLGDSADIVIIKMDPGKISDINKTKDEEKNASKKNHPENSTQIVKKIK